MLQTPSQLDLRITNTADSDLPPGKNLRIVDCEEQDDDADTQPVVEDLDPPTARRYPRSPNRQRADITEMITWDMRL